MSSYINNKQGNQYNQFYQKQIQMNNQIQFSFEDAIFQPQKIIPILESCLDNQKNFIDFMLDCFKGFPEVKSIKHAKQIMNILPVIIRKLSLPFASLLLDENELLQLFIDIFVNNSIFSEQITSAFENIYYLYENIENELMNSPLDDWKDLLIELGIIKEDEKYNENEYLTIVEDLYIKLNNLFDNWVQFRQMGNYIEEENLNEFDNYLKAYIEDYNSLVDDNSVSNATIEFFAELISKIQEFRNEKFSKDYQYVNNEMSLEDEINDDNFLDNENYSNLNKGNNINSIMPNNNYIKKQNIKEILNSIKNIPLHKRTFFYKNEKILEGENQYIEYKNYYFPFGDKQIMELRRQICGFINSNGGRLYLGITDEEKIIKGIVLNANSLNTFQNILFSCIDNFTPHILNGKIKIFYIPIKNIKNNSIINDLYIIKIIIYPGDPTILYSISPHKFISSMRLQGQCANLTAEEIYKEVILRNKKKGMNTIKSSIELDFNDPEPEKIEDSQNYCEDNDEDGNNYYNNKYDYVYENDNTNIKERTGEMNYRVNRAVKRRKKKHKKKAGKAATLKVYNIDQGILAKDISNLFRNCGCFSGKFFAKRNGRSSGFGYLLFANENLANNCISKFNNAKIGNKNIKFKRENIK